MACWAWPRRCHLIVLDKWLTNLKLFHSYVILAKLVIFAHNNAMFLTCSPFSRRVCLRLISCWTRVYITYTWGGFWNVHLLMMELDCPEVTLCGWLTGCSNQVTNQQTNPRWMEADQWPSLPSTRARFCGSRLARFKRACSTIKSWWPFWPRVSLGQNSVAWYWAECGTLHCLCSAVLGRMQADPGTDAGHCLV